MFVFSGSGQISILNSRDSFSFLLIMVLSEAQHSNKIQETSDETNLGHEATAWKSWFRMVIKALTLV